MIDLVKSTKQSQVCCRHPNTPAYHLPTQFESDFIPWINYESCEINDKSFEINYLDLGINRGEQVNPSCLYT